MAERTVRGAGSASTGAGGEPAAPARRPSGAGVYRRRIRLVAGDARVTADLEDDFHRFRVTLEHDGRAVTAARGEARRYPWTSCPGAARPLEALAGLALGRDCTLVSGYTDPRRNCTHQLDLAGLAAAHAARVAAGAAPRRQYDAEVPDRVAERTRPRLSRDGDLVLVWALEGSEITGPEPFRGRSLRGAAWRAWLRDESDPDRAEAAIVLRRACYIAFGRATPLDAIPRAHVFMSRIAGSCHTFQPGVVEEALRMVGSTFDFTDTPERLLADLGEG